MAELPWPKSMRYPASALRWVRPLTSIVCLFDGDVLPLALDDVPVGRITRGHRFPVAWRNLRSTVPPNISAKLDDAHVVLDRTAAAR